MRASLMVALIAAGVVGAAPTPAQRERDAFTAEVARLADSGDFSTLEAVYRSLVAEDPRYAGGISKLVDFYDGLGMRSDVAGTAPFLVRQERYREWMARSPRWHLPKVGLAKLAVAEAWRARGSGFADKVPQEAWPEYERHLAVASSWMQKALADQPSDPQFYSELIDVCRLQSCPRAQAERMLEAGTRLNPRYESIYVSMANYLLPRWNGTAEEFVQFAEQAADSHPDLGDLLYLRIATVALLQSRKSLTVEMPGLDWARIRSGLAEAERRYPGSMRTQHLLALFGVSYKDRAIARAAFDRIGPWDPVEGRPYWITEEYFRGRQRWAFAGTVP